MKIAFITSRFPYPTEKGDKLRAFQHLIWLAARHEVHLFAISHHPVAEEHLNAVRQLCAGVHVFHIGKARFVWNLISGWLGGLPVSVAYFFDSNQKRRMQDAIIRLKPDHLYVQLIRAADYVRALPLPKTLDYMDVFSEGAKQRAQAGNVLLRPFYEIEARRLRDYETEVYADFTNHMIISQQDRDRLPLAYKGSIAVVPNGVDTGYFAPMTDRIPEYDVVFVGNLGYAPNIEAAVYLVQRIMPLVWHQCAGARVCITGARPHRRALRLQSERVSVEGWVEDIRDAYAKGKVFVAPMFSGLGQQNKILEAMAMQLPCITTGMVDNAIGGAREGAVLVAENDASFAKAICNLLRNPLEAESLGVTARTFVCSHYSWEAKNILMENLFTQALDIQQPELTQV